ncbi:family 16 glycosylhydrolase [Sphingomonas sp. S2-65]|uniref:glycoside hydrolase family 16 protein n=1 Tax=Sphingomonas sp. S2-65 TaxID=2903960 RepID=UPI001F4302E9|nr:family 16 glycosylhydrolase [Sphingomonas sp. S2-65]UYY57053.1 family 16 glycosylhydrolase [Sphingomonas sp. S2-65]
MATVSIGDLTYPLDATQVDVPVRLDRATPNTVHVRVKTANGSGANYAISGTHFQGLDKFIVFRPGDPLVQTVTIKILKTKEGGHFKLSFPEAPMGANPGTSTAILTSIAGASPSTPINTGFRAPRTFHPTGTLSYDMNPATVRWSDKGGPGVLSTSFTHGRTQPANGENGLYLDNVLHPGAEAPFSTKDGKLVLHSQALATPINYGGVGYYYGAAMLSGRNTPETQLTYGQYEWVATMPTRRGSWPALWLIGVRGWPPEIDVYEGFGQNASWDFERDISANIHGGPVNQRSFTRSMWVDATSAYGISNIASAAHRYALDIQSDYITWFVDGIETYQARNPFSEPFYPVMNVAVKTSGAFTDGSGDMSISSFRVWRNR